MNHIHRVIWNASTSTWQVVSEIGHGRSRSQSDGRRRSRRGLAAAAALVLASSAAWAGGVLPTGGSVVAGAGSIRQAGNAMTVLQSTDKMSLNWQSFSIGQGNSVTFQQPSMSSVALNRVLGPDVSTIQGALRSNGQVFLLNPNGVLFSPTAQVSTGGLLASTLGLSDTDFLAGHYQLEGNSAASVVNQGRLQAAPAGAVALVAAKVSNVGSIAADQGSVLLGAGSQVLVDFGGPTKLQVQKGAVDALIENGGAIRADGGTILLTAKSASELAGSVINNTGVIQARTLAIGQQGEIRLLGDMGNGTLNVGGTLDTSAPAGGAGGNIETSAAQVNTLAGLHVNAGAREGSGGTWTVDPYNYTIGATAAGNIDSALNNGTSVTITTQSSNTAYGAGTVSTGVGDITVSSAISKSAGTGAATLTLQADHNILVNADIGATSGKLNITLSSANAAGATTGGVDVNGNLQSNGGNILIGGGASSSVATSLLAGASAVNNVHGIGFALNLSATQAAVQVEQGKSILSSGGNIVINGKSLVGASSGSYDATRAGVYLLSNSTVLSGTGNMLMTGESEGGSRTFGVAVEGNSGTQTTLGSSTTGGVTVVNALNYAGGVANDSGTLGFVSFGSRSRVQLMGNSVADWLMYIDGVPQATIYTQQLSNCSTATPNCGAMQVPGSNGSYLYATYNAVDMATSAAWLVLAGGSKVYDGTTTASGLTYNIIGGPGGSFSASSLTPNPIYTTSSKNAGSYTSLTANPANPVDYQASATSTKYAIGYFDLGGYTYNITAKPLSISVGNKVYDGTNTAAIASAGIVSGDTVSITGSGAFAGTHVGTYTVSVTGATLSGADAANYSLSGTSASGSASITPRPLTVTGSKVYDGSASLAGDVTFGNLVAGESLTYSGATANSANVASASYINAITLGNGTGGLASDYALPGLTAATASNSAVITPRTLTLTGVTALDKAYDGTTAAALSGGTLTGLVAGQTLNFADSGSFSDRNAGAGKAVTANVTLTDGTGLASNYTIAQPTGLTASITPKSLTVSGITASDKVYDGSTAAAVNTAGMQLTGLVAGDSVTVSATGAFSDKNAGAGKTVALTSTDAGADAGNYTIANQASTTANITPRALTVSGITASNKTYDGTTTAALNTSNVQLTGLVAGDNVTVAATGVFGDKNAATGKTVGLTSTDGGTDAGNYTFTNQASATASITPRSLTVSGITAADKTYDGTTAATVNTGNVQLAGLVAGDNVTVSATGAFSDKNAGTGKTVALTSTDGGADAGNYTFTNQASATANVAPKALTVSGITASDKTYDGSTAAAVNTAGMQLTGLIASDSVTVSATGAFSDKNVGIGKTVALTSTDAGADAGNYTIANQVSASANITPRALSVSGVTASNKIYDGTTAATVNTSNVQLTGLVAGDNVTVAATGAFTDKNAATGKTVTLTSTDGGTDAGNYTFTNQASATASITPKALTVSGITATDKTYDGTTAATVNTSGAQLTGLVAGDNVSVVATGAFSDKNAGTGKSVALVSTDGGADAGNYTITGQASTTANITPKALTVSGITASDKVYDGSTAATVNTSGAQLTGLIAGDNVTVAAAGAFSDKNVGTGKAVTLTSTEAGADAGNYTFTNQASTAASITPKALTVSGITASDKVYDGTTAVTVATGNVQLTGLVAGDSVTVSATGAFSDKNAGTGKTVALTSTDAGVDAGNYTIANQTGTTANITPKALTVSGITASDKTYDGTTAATMNTSGVQLTGVVTGDSVTVSTTGAFSDKNVGIGKTVTLTSTDAGVDAGNYTIVNQASTTANITPRALTVSGITASNKTYDGTAAAAVNTGNAQLTGLVAGDNVTVAATGVFADKNAGTGKAVTLTSTDGGADAGNYTFTNQASTTANITPKALTISGITAADKTYDGATTAAVNTGNVQLTGLVAGDNVTVATTGAFTDKNAGTGKTVALTSTDGGADAGNYTVTNQSSTTANITPKTLTVSGITASNKTYDGTTTAAVNTGNAQLTGLVAGDNVTVAATGAFTDKNAGTGKTVALTSTDGGADAGNYTFTNQASTTANIAPKSLTVSGITASDKTYDGTTTATVNTSGAQLTGLVAGDNVTVAATGVFGDKNAGTGKTVTLASTDGGTDAANYAFTNQSSATANITPKALTVSGITASDKVYDGTTTATVNTSGAQLTGLVAGDNVTVAATGVFGDKNAATGKTVALTSTDGGADAGNYTFTNQASTTANIASKALTVSGITAADKVYDGSTAAAVNTSGILLAGLVAGDNVTVSATGAFSDKNAGAGKTVALTSTDAGADAGNYTIANQASTSANITPRALTVSGITASNKTYDGTTTAALNTSNVQLTGLVAGDNVTVAATGAFTDKNAATGKTVALTSTDGGADAGNYTVTNQASTTANITPKSLTVSGITAADKTYDGTTAATVNTGNVQLTGLVAGDNVTVAATGAFADKNAATGKTVTLTSTDGGTDAGNYTFTNQASATASITPKALTISGITAIDKTYDGTTAATVNTSGAQLTGLVTGDNVSVVATGVFADKTAGTGKTVTLTSTDGGTDAGNYTVTNQASTTANITPKSLTVSGITAADKTYDGTTAATVNTGNVQLAGLVAGDSVTVSATGAFADKNAAVGKTVTLTSTDGGADAGNYTITGQASATANITPKALTVSGITATDKTYDGTTAAMVNTGNVQFTGLIAGDSVTVTATGAFIDKNAGASKGVTLTSTDRGADAGNYSIANQTSTTATIAPKTLTVSGVTASDKVYDGTTAVTLNTSGLQLAGLVAGDSVAVSTSGAFSDKNAGTNKTVTLTSTDGGADAGNYAIANQASATATIAPRPLTVSGVAAQNKTYDGSLGATLTSPGTLANVVAGDTVSVDASGAVASFAQPGPGTGLQVNVTGLALSGTDARNYAFGGSAVTAANVNPAQSSNAQALVASSVTHLDGGTTLSPPDGGVLTYTSAESGASSTGGLTFTSADPSGAGTSGALTFSGTGNAAPGGLTITGTGASSTAQADSNAMVFTAADAPAGASAGTVASSVSAATVAGATQPAAGASSPVDAASGTGAPVPVGVGGSVGSTSGSMAASVPQGGTTSGTPSTGMDAGGASNPATTPAGIGTGAGAVAPVATAADAQISSTVAGTTGGNVAASTSGAQVTAGTGDATAGTAASAAAGATTAAVLPGTSTGQSGSAAVGTTAGAATGTQAAAATADATTGTAAGTVTTAAASANTSAGQSGTVPVGTSAGAATGTQLAAATGDAATGVASPGTSAGQSGTAAVGSPASAATGAQPAGATGETATGVASPGTSAGQSGTAAVGTTASAATGAQPAAATSDAAPGVASPGTSAGQSGTVAVGSTASAATGAQPAAATGDAATGVASPGTSAGQSGTAAVGSPAAAATGAQSAAATEGATAAASPGTASGQPGAAGVSGAPGVTGADAPTAAGTGAVASTAGTPAAGGESSIAATTSGTTVSPDTASSDDLMQQRRKQGTDDANPQAPGALNYVADGDAPDTGSNPAATGTVIGQHEAATQELTASRRSRFLNVVVVSGGIRMPGTPPVAPQQQAPKGRN